MFVGNLDDLFKGRQGGQKGTSDQTQQHLSAGRWRLNFDGRL